MQIVTAHADESTVAVNSAPPCRKPYRKPALTRFGEVRLLTQAGSNLPLENSIGSSDNCNSADTPHRACAPSDRRIKCEIVRIGEHPLGFGLYLFEYQSAFKAELGGGRHFGVIAQEVEPIVPGAVETHPSGFKAVNYEMLGIRTADGQPQAT
jgi:hypothetical protein